MNTKKQQPIIVVTGYHFGYIKRKNKQGKICDVPYVDNNPYAFKLTKKTKNVMNVAKYKKWFDCIVKTKRGKRHLIVMKIQAMNGTISRKMASHCQPVLSVRGRYTKPFVYAIMYKFHKNFKYKTMPADIYTHMMEYGTNKILHMCNLKKTRDKLIKRHEIVRKDKNVGKPV